ncbi:hypothetical protein L208DRAFT_1385809 [Tricholoma matsutake]|nr:hypothetical protein L208DRAFT_1385809 [Tricholoma matsutake 945]
MDDHPAGVKKCKRLNSALKIMLPLIHSDEVIADPTENFEPEPHEATTEDDWTPPPPLHQKRCARICLSQPMMRGLRN